MNARALSTDILLGIVPLALLVTLWQALVTFGYAPITLLPSPGIVGLRLVQQLVTGAFLQEIAVTLFRLFAGFSIAVMLGVGIGLAAAVNPAVNAVVRPVVRCPVVRVRDAPSLLTRGTIGTVAALSGARSLLDGTPTLSRPFSRNSFDNDIVNHADSIGTWKLRISKSAGKGGPNAAHNVSETRGLPPFERYLG